MVTVAWRKSGNKVNVYVNDTHIGQGNGGGSVTLLTPASICIGGGARRQWCSICAPSNS